MISRLLLQIFLFVASVPVFGQSFTSAGGPIPDNGSWATFSIPVSGLPTELNTQNFGLERVCVNIAHSWVGDLSISLRAPDGTVIPLVSGVGGDTDGFVNTCLSSNAPTSIFQVWYPFTGEFRPFGDMGTVNNGQDPNGTWELLVLDTYPFADEGELLDWGITFGNNPCKPFPFVSSDLPILKINTNGLPIVNEPKVDAWVQIIDNGPGERNYVAQTDYAYEGPIGIEQRGNSSQGMPKKSYTFEFRDENGDDKDVELFGLPKGSDFVLSANFSDKTLMRNALAYETFRQMGNYASRTRFCELMLNNTYQGVYIYTEDIRRDKNRVDISKLTESDTAGVELTGGYMVRIDWNRTPGWDSQFTQPNNPNKRTYFQHVYPRWNEMHPNQTHYIRSYVDSFEVALHGSNFQDPEQGWRRFADEKTFIDYLILNELSKNVDGYRLSTFFYKLRDDKGGKLRMGPPWDYDLAWYNADYCENWNTSGWAFDINYVCQDAGVPFWWEKLMADEQFRQNLACRWQYLRSTVLSKDHFFAKVDSMAAVLSESAGRNFLQWPILGQYVWPNPGPLPTTYAGEVNKMKVWVNNRMAWLDITFGEFLPQIASEFETVHQGAYTLQFAAQVNPGYQYTWDFGDGTTANGAVAQHIFPGPGTYQVELSVQTPFGCKRTSKQILHIVSTGISGASSGDLALRFFPQPAQGTLSVVLPENCRKNGLFRLVNALGSIVLERNVSENDTKLELDVEQLPPGTYMAELRSDCRRAAAKILIGI
jgi:subtilisin-like proprotein convertase family protein